MFVHGPGGHLHFESIVIQAEGTNWTLPSDINCTTRYICNYVKFLYTLRYFAF